MTTPELTPQQLQTLQAELHQTEELMLHASHNTIGYLGMRHRKIQEALETGHIPQAENVQNNPGCLGLLLQLFT